MPSGAMSLAGRTALVTSSGRKDDIVSAIAKGGNGVIVALNYVSEGSTVRRESDSPSRSTRASKHD